MTVRHHNGYDRRDKAKAAKEATSMSKDAVYAAMVALAKSRHPGDDEPAAIAKLLKTTEGADLYSHYVAADSAERAGVTVSKVAAELTVEAYAVEVRKAHPHLSYEQAYVVAMKAHPELAALAIGAPI